MCGINGICGFKGNLIENIRRMNERIIRRGPDSGNYWLDENAGLALGHRRLAIVDLTENGAQPMISSDQRYVMVFNGEIYNKDQVWEHMLAKNIHVTLRGTSDTEVILESFANIGIEETLNLMKGQSKTTLSQQCHLQARAPYQRITLNGMQKILKSIIT